MPVFTPPTTKEPFAPPLHRWTFDRGVSVWKTGGVWHQQQNPSWDQLDGADALPAGDTSESSAPGKYAWLGGYNFTVTSTVGDELTAEGYTVA